MKSFKEKLLVMLGREPQKPAAYSPEAEQIHKLKRLNKADFEAMKQHTREHQLLQHKWRNRRWAVLIAVNLLFVVSFWLDIQMLEGALTASRFVGFLLRGAEAPEAGSGNCPRQAVVRLPSSKGNIASRLNLTQEHFSRILHELSEGGLIVVEGRKIAIPDVEKLRAYEL